MAGQLLFDVRGFVLGSVGLWVGWAGSMKVDPQTTLWRHGFAQFDDINVPQVGYKRNRISVGLIVGKNRPRFANVFIALAGSKIAMFPFSTT